MTFFFLEHYSSIDVFPLDEMLILKSRFKREKKRQNFCLPKPERVLYVAKCGSGAEKGLGNPQCCYQIIHDSTRGILADNDTSL